MNGAKWLYAQVQATELLDRYPLYAAVLARLGRAIVDPGIHAMAVSTHDGRIFLHVNPRWARDNPRFVRGVLLHEVHHVVLGHLTHPKFRGLAHPDLLEVAMETTANESIIEPLPPHVSWTQFADLGMRPQQSTMERYELLVGARRGGRAPATLIAARMTSTVDDHGALAAALASEGDEAAQKTVDGIVADVVRDATRGARLAGAHPASILEELADDGERAAAIDWRQALQQFVIAHRRGLQWSYSRPNRRFLYRTGEVPARSRRLVRNRPSVLVAIDTSASISRAQLAEVARQLVRAAADAELLVTECDAKIHRTYAFEGELRGVMGRGGTDLRPPFAPAFLRRHNVGGVVYFTDGHGPFPAEPPSVPVLWVLSAGGFACPWGARVEVGGDM